MNHTQRARVSADFPTHERDILQQLCEQDIRPPAEQLRWLVLNEAQRRGILGNNKSAASQTWQGENSSTFAEVVNPS
jgi:hypothetical protein